MKIALITDQHFGARNDSQIFLDYYEEFYSNVFFPKLEEEGIQTLFMLGDTFDRRKYINFNTLQRAQQMFFGELEKREITTYMLVGNHDTFYKNTNNINALDELVKNKYDYIHVYDNEPCEIHNNGILLLPWICDENRQRMFKAINDSRAPIEIGRAHV